MSRQDWQDAWRLARRWGMSIAGVATTMVDLRLWAAYRCYHMRTFSGRWLETPLELRLCARKHGVTDYQVRPVP